MAKKSGEAAGCRFGPDYREEVVLADGSRVALRMVRLSDRELLRSGFARLSPESRYLRFFSGKPRLTDKELEYLSRVDGVDHVAIGAVHLQANGDEEGVGVARFVRRSDEADMAEPAVTVVDAWQRRGLGTLLMQRLAQAARERGIRRFHVEYLAVNRGVRKLIEEMAIHTAGTVVEQDGVVCAELPIPDPPEAGGAVPVASRSLFQKLLSPHAAGKVTMRVRRTLLKGSDTLPGEE